MRIDTILCPIDFSASSKEALAVAVDFSKRMGARLVVAHVYQPPTYVLPDGSVLLASPDALNDLIQHVESALDQWRKDAEALGATGVVTRAVQGIAWQEIVRLGEEAPGTMIVIGTHGRTGLKRLLLGSVAEHVVRTSPAPVLTVRSSDYLMGELKRGNI